MNKERPQPLKELILRRLRHLGWSHYRLVTELGGRVPASTIYDYLRGQYEIKSHHLWEIFEVLKLKVLPTERDVEGEVETIYNAQEGERKLFHLLSEYEAAKAKREQIEAAYRSAISPDTDRSPSDVRAAVGPNGVERWSEAVEEERRLLMECLWVGATLSWLPKPKPVKAKRKAETDPEELAWYFRHWRGDRRLMRKLSGLGDIDLVFGLTVEKFVAAAVAKAEADNREQEERRDAAEMAAFIEVILSLRPKTGK